MSTGNLNLVARLSLDAQRWVQGLGRAQGGLKGFVSRTRADFAQLRNEVSGLTGQLAGIGLAWGTAATVMQSARMDKSLVQIQQTAGATRAEMEGLRGELFRMGQQTGQSVDDLQGGFNALIQGGLTWRESLQVIQATNQAMAVTGAQAETLAGTLGVAQQAFNFDLAKPKVALQLLDKMTVAGRLGNAELENLGPIFSRIGVNAAGAGFGFEKTLAFIEGLSMVERQPERLATLADSTLRLFTNAKYMKDSQKATGIQFFDNKGGRRDPLVILADIKKKYDALRTDAERHRFLSKAFGQADLDTIKGLKTLLGGDMLATVNRFASRLESASGTIERDLPAALANSVDQAGRLKSLLREAADGFARPINQAIGAGIGKLMNPRSQGGMELSGGQVAGLGVAAALSALLAKRLGGRALSGLLDKFGKGGSVAGGVAAGKALEAAAGVTPVYVTNYAQIGGAAGALADAAGAAGGAGLGSAGKGALAGLAARLGLASLPGLATTGVGALAGAGAYGGAVLAGGVGLAAAGGYGAGKVINLGLEGSEAGDKIGAGVARFLAAFGNKEAREAIERMDRMEASAKLNGELAVHIDSEGRATVTKMQMNTPGVTLRANTGRATAGTVPMFGGPR